jgi:hypothetical protein
LEHAPCLGSIETGCYLVYEPISAATLLGHLLE